MALMAAHAEITPMPDCAIFADTQAEPAYVYRQLDFLCEVCPFPILNVTKDSLTDNMFSDGFSQIPAFFDRSKKRLTKGKRQCTTKWKILPMYKAVREFTDTVGKHLPEGFTVIWLGISTDEASRMKDSREKWIHNRYPLIELGMSRTDCEEWLQRNAYPIPKRSACVFCPLQTQAEWKEKRDAGGDEWGVIRDTESRLIERGEYLDPFGVGLDNYIDNVWPGQPNLFENECEGMCGV